MDPLPPTVALPEVAAASSHTLTVTPRSNGGPLSPGVSRKDKSEKSEKSFRGIGSRKLSKRGMIKSYSIFIQILKQRSAVTFS